MKKKQFEPPDCPPVTTRIESNEDNWKHRSSAMVCKTCMFFTNKVSNSGEIKLGRCRRHSPTMSGWPVMQLTDWCGDHKLDENKI
jgi:hypothetical protein